MKPLPQEMSGRSKLRNLHKGILVFGSLATINIAIILVEWTRRSDLLIGLSDESYLYSQLISSAKDDDSTAMFATILGVPFNWLNGSILNYRLFGILIVSAIAIITGVLVERMLRQDKSNSYSLSLAVLSSVTVLLIPSTFRYLLLNPGYQWLIILTSVVASISLIRLTDAKTLSKKTFAILFISLFLVLQISLYTRVTYFLIIFTILLISVLFVKKESQTSYLILIFGSILFFVLTQSFLLSKWKEIIINASKIDPNGYSIFSEIADVSVSILLVAGTLLVGNKLLTRENSFSQPKLFYFVFMTLGISLLLAWIIFSRDRLAPFVFFCTILTGKFVPSTTQLLNQKGKFFFLILVSFLPVYSQFGSNTSALSNSNFVLISLSLLLVISSPFRAKDPGHLISFFAAMLACVALMQVVNSQRSFETSLDNSRKIKILGDDLFTSNEIAQNIDNFKQNFERAKIPADEKILDLSFFHPGGGLFLNHEVLPLGTADRFFEETFFEQFTILVDEYAAHFRGKFGLTLISVPRELDLSTHSSCKTLGEWLKFQSKRELSMAGESLMLRYKVLSQLESDRIQVNLHPQNLVILSKCEDKV